MLKQILNKFLILNDVQAAIVIQENGEIIQSMKSGIVIKEELQDVIATIMLDSKKTAAQFGNASLSMVFVEFSESFPDPRAGDGRVLPGDHCKKHCKYRADHV